MALPETTTTIEEFIKSGSNITVSYPTFTFKDILTNGTMVAIHDVINDYIVELRNACVNVRLTQEQQWTYLYKPKLLCYDVYGNPELYFIILLINDMADVKEFSKPTIKMLKKEHMNEILTLIYNAEKQYIDEYNDKK